MAEHVWTVLCRRGVQDAGNGILTLSEVIDYITVHGDHRADLEKAKLEGKQGIMLLMQMDLVSVWVRSDYSKAEVADMSRISFTAPSGSTLILKEQPINLGGVNTSFRHLLNFSSVPVSEFGLHWIIVEHRRPSKSKTPRWKIATKLPLEIVAES